MLIYGAQFEHNRKAQGHNLLKLCFSSEISKNGMWAGGSLPLSIIHSIRFKKFLKSKFCQIMAKIIMVKYR